MMERQYKDSGIEWIGRIPKEWKILPHKHIMRKKKDLCMKYNGEDIISLTTNGVIVRDLSAGGKMPTSFDGYQYVNPGELLLCLFDIDVTPRCVGYVKNSGLTSPAYSRFILAKDTYAPYYDYLLRYMDDEKCLLHLSKNLRSSLTEEDFGQIQSILPPLTEQQRIASYLDKKCGEIDELIALQEKMIAQLTEYKQAVITEAVTKGLDPNAKLVPSGIEWIGDVPEGWKVNSIKRLMKIYAGATPKSDDDSFWDGDIVWITPADYKTEDIYVSEGRRNITELGLNSCATTILPVGSLIFSKRAPIGLVAINKKELCTNQGCLGCIVNASKAIAKYYYYALSIFKEQFELYGSGTTFKEISASSFANFIVPLPSLPDQQRIASYLDTKCSEIESLIALKRQKIESLNAYKKSVIYEAVTGKTIIE